MRPSIIVTVTNKAGKAIESYSCAYPRFTHANEELAYTRAFYKVQEDLAENFLLDYRGVY